MLNVKRRMRERWEKKACAERRDREISKTADSLFSPSSIYSELFMSWKIGNWVANSFDQLHMLSCWLAGFWKLDHHRLFKQRPKWWTNGDDRVQKERKRRKVNSDVFKLFFPLEKKSFNTVLVFFHILVLFLSICLIYCNNFSKSVQW